MLIAHCRAAAAAEKMREKRRLRRTRAAAAAATITAGGGAAAAKQCFNTDKQSEFAQLSVCYRVTVDVFIHKYYQNNNGVD